MKTIPLKANALLLWLVNRKTLVFGLICGSWLSLAYPPLPFAFFLFAGFIPFLALIERRYYPGQITTSKLWFTLYLAFLVWNFLTCYWLMFTALFVGDTQEATLAFTAGLLANFANAFLQTLPLMLYAYLRKKNSNQYWTLGGFIFFWLSFEYLHFNWDLSWSWITLGHAFTFYPTYIQFIEFTGVLGISFWILLINALLWLGISGQRHSKTFTLAGSFSLIFPLLIAPLIMHPQRKVFQKSGQLKVRIVQPNIDPYEKFNYLSEEAQITSFIEQIKNAPLNGVDLVALPETALPFYLEEGSVLQRSLLSPLLELCAKENCSILTGAVAIRYFQDCENAPVSARTFADERGNKYCFETYNAATVLYEGAPGRLYKKAKLVPFTERTPFLEQLSFLKGWEIDLGGGMGSFGYPDSIFPLSLHNKVLAAPIICYESQFGDYVRLLFLKGAELGCIITNDGWFGNSSGYIQHAYLATLRAIENRREFARCANTGMSLFVDNKGNIEQKLGWWKKGTLDRTMNLYQEKTFYMTHGDYIGRLSLGLSIIIFIISIGEPQLRKITLAGKGK